MGKRIPIVDSTILGRNSFTHLPSPHLSSPLMFTQTDRQVGSYADIGLAMGLYEVYTGFRYGYPPDNHPPEGCLDSGFRKGLGLRVEG